MTEARHQRSEVSSLWSVVTKAIISFALCALLFALSVPVEAQQPKKIYRIGYISSGPGIEVREEAFRQALRELGYIEGRNLVIEWRFANGRITQRPELAADLIGLKVDCIVATGSGETAIDKKATHTIPIVMMS